MAVTSFDLKSIFQRDNAIVIICLILVITLSSAYILSGAGMPYDMPAMMGSQADWSLNYSIVIFLMWWIMMLAMMLPSATPMILLFAMLNRKNGDASYLNVIAFVGAYIVIWGGFSIAATALQWGVGDLGLLSGKMATENIILGGMLLISAGIWQLTPLKHSCLRHCRSPIHFFATSWQPGMIGAFQMGAKHGAFCLGCCWVLMALLFYGGVMNLWWIAGLALYVLIEKLAPFGQRIGKYTGALLILWGVGVMSF